MTENVNEIILNVNRILHKLHQNLYNHFLNNGMPKTASSFLQESKFFPEVSGSAKGYPSDILFRCWSSNFFGGNSLEDHSQISQPDETTQNNADEVTTSFGKVVLTLRSCKYQRIVFPCKYPGCTSTFRTPANKKRHEKLHTGEKPFECSYDNCDKRQLRH